MQVGKKICSIQDAGGLYDVFWHWAHIKAEHNTSVLVFYAKLDYLLYLDEHWHREYYK
jgi:hypothetical protein